MIVLHPWHLPADIASEFHVRRVLCYTARHCFFLLKGIVLHMLNYSPLEKFYHFKSMPTISLQLAYDILYCQTLVIRTTVYPGPIFNYLPCSMFWILTVNFRCSIFSYEYQKRIYQFSWLEVTNMHGLSLGVRKRAFYGILFLFVDISRVKFFRIVVIRLIFLYFVTSEVH